MATIVRGKILRSDLAGYDGKTVTATRVDSTGGTVTGLVPDYEVDALALYGLSANRTVGTLNSAITNIGSSNATIVLAPGTWTIDSNVTIPSNINIRLPAGAQVSVDNGITLTIAGQVFADVPTDLYIGAGTVTVSDEGSHAGIWYKSAAEASASVSPTDMTFPVGDVRRYGADPTGSASSQTAFETALSSAGSWKVYVPNGTYTLTATININNKQEIEGESSEGAILSASGLTGAMFSIDPGAVSTQFRGIRIRNLGFQVASGSGTTHFIDFVGHVTYYATDVEFSDLDFSGAGTVTRACIEIENTWESRFEKLSFRATASIAYILVNSTVSAGGCNGVQFSDIYSTDTGSTPYGILVMRKSTGVVHQGITFTNCTLQGHTVGLWLADVTSAQVIGFWGEANSTSVQVGDYNKTSIDGETAYRAGDYVSIIGGYFEIDQSGDIGIRADLAKHLVIQNASLYRLTAGNWIELGRVANAMIIGSGDVTAGDLIDQIGFNASYTSTNECILVDMGTQDSSIVQTTSPSIRLFNDTGSWPIGLHKFITFVANDATPSVDGGINFKTANSSPTTITDFDGGRNGQVITVVINDANTTIDFTASGLKGNAGADWTPTTGDHMTCVYDGTDWFCRISDNTA